MYYGHAPHVPSPEDLTVMWCICGWRSKELSRQEIRDLGVPWYCDECNNKNLMWVKFHPTERAKALLLVPEPLLMPLKV